MSMLPSVSKRKDPIMTRQTESTTVSPAVEQAIQIIAEQGIEGMPQVFGLLLNQAMKIERDNALGAGPYERSESRKGHANGFKPKTLDTRLGRIVVDVPQTRGTGFYPSVLERGVRSERALRLAIAEMYIRGVSTRKVQHVMQKLCGLDVTSAQVSRASACLDEELQQWLRRPLDQIPYLILDARYEKVRIGCSVLSTGVLIALGVRPDGRRMILGVSVAASEAESHWREFLFSLQRRGLHGVKYIVSDDHCGLKSAVACCFPGVLWQRCQFHLMQNAMQHVPKIDQRLKVAADLRQVFDAPDRDAAQRRLHQLADKYAHWPRFAAWLEQNVPEGFAVFSLPAAHRKRLRTSNALERINKEIRRRTRVVEIFPNEQSLLRLVTALLIEYSDQWEASNILYLNINLNVNINSQTP
jgi:putative transposase